MNYEEQKRKLLEEREQLITSLNELGYALAQKKDWVVRIENDEEEHMDSLDDAEMTEELERDIATLNVIEQRYQEVENALTRIESGTYGICKICGKKIEKERLNANPSATTCEKHMNEKTAS